MTPRRGVLYGNLHRLLVPIVAVASVLQWVVVLERAWAAVWAWYKFAGYGGGGRIDVGATTQALFLGGSATVAFVAYAVWKAERADAPSGPWARLAWLSYASIVVCTLFWVALLASPLVAFSRD